MLIKINGYHSGYRVCAFAMDEKNKDEMLKMNDQVMYLRDGILTFYPEEIHYRLDEAVLVWFGDRCNYDVFEISGEGLVYQFYNSRSDDMVFVLTEKCNSNCVMCPSPDQSRKRGGSLNLDTARRVAFCLPDDIPHITITGGEPFLFGPDIFDFFQLLKDRFQRTEVLVLTNGRIFSVPEYCQKLSQTIPSGTVFGIPLHGYDSKTHDSITRSAGSFEQTVIGLHNLLALNVRVEIRLVVSLLNASFITKIAELIANDFQAVLHVKIMGLEMLGNAAVNKEKVWLPYNEAFRTSKKAILVLLQAGIDVGLYNFPLCAVEQEFWGIYDHSISDYKIRYTDACEQCSKKESCGGIFAGTLRLVEQDVKPFN